MASATLNYGFPYPTASDNVNIPSDFANLAIDIDSDLYLLSASVQSKVSLSGATFTGAISGTSASFSGNVTSASPTLSSHLATKSYVDSTAISAGVYDATYITSDYTLDLLDSGAVVAITSASATTITIPLESSVAFSTGTVIRVVRTGTGEVTIASSAGLISNSATNKLSSQYTAVTLYKTGSDAWLAIFDGASGGDGMLSTFLLMGA